MAAIHAGRRRGQVVVEMHEARARQVALRVEFRAEMVRSAQIVTNIDDDERRIAEDVGELGSADQRRMHR